MHQAAENVIRQRMERTAQALRKNNMEAICVDSAAEVLPAGTVDCAGFFRGHRRLCYAGRVRCGTVF